MMRRLTGLAALTCALLWPAGALGATTPNQSFEDTENTTPGAYQSDNPPESRVPNSFQTHDVTVLPGEQNGKMNVHIEWASADDDWDMYIYRVEGSTLSLLKSSAQGGTTEEDATVDSGTLPLEPGTYRIYVDNWAAADPPGEPSWHGTITFQEFIPPNLLPAAAISAPDRVAPGTAIDFNASGSSDPDGQVVNYSWDFDGNGSFETDAQGSPTISKTLTEGLHRVTLRVKDDRGGTGFAYKTLVVGEAPIVPPKCELDRASSRVIRVSRRGSVAMKLRCETRDAFVGDVLLETARRVRVSATLRRLGLARGKFSAPGGAGERAVTVRLRLGRRSLRALERLGRTRVVAKTSVELADGKVARSAFRFFLTPPRRR
jgi:hypothetical protein